MRFQDVSDITLFAADSLPEIAPAFHFPRLMLVKINEVSELCSEGVRKENGTDGGAEVGCKVKGLEGWKAPALGERGTGSTELPVASGGALVDGVFVVIGGTGLEHLPPGWKI